VESLSALGRIVSGLHTMKLQLRRAKDVYATVAHIMSTLYKAKPASQPLSAPTKKIRPSELPRDGWDNTFRSLKKLAVFGGRFSRPRSNTCTTISATRLAARTHRAEVPKTLPRVGCDRVEVPLSDREADWAPPLEPRQGFPGPLCLCEENQGHVLSGSLPADRVRFST
jgi:hypothetical protein